MIVEGNLIDVHQRRIYPARIEIKGDTIINIKETKKRFKYFICPGFVDAHVHIESSMLVPSRFAEMVIPYGTVATVSDPHEIANVCGIDGIEYMKENATKCPLKVYFGVPSCVPATNYETSGAKIDSAEVERLLQSDEYLYLSEMMNYPGVVYNDTEVQKKLHSAIKYSKRIDGHAPGLRGKDLDTYCNAGITTDHESYTMEEALEKIGYGMKIQIREGSAAKNYEALKELLKTHPDKVMFCNDDAHPDDLIHNGHIDKLVKRAVIDGYDVFDVLKAASTNAISHYGLDVGQLRIGDKADFILVSDIEKFYVERVFINGSCVCERHKNNFNGEENNTINNFNCDRISDSDIKVNANNKKIRIIEVIDGEIITKSFVAQPKTEEGYIIPDIENDILKIIVYNRYKKSRPVVGFVKNFSLKFGAIASSIAHDSHNIVAVGTNDRDIIAAVDLLIESKGGISYSNDGEMDVLPLPIAGLMSTDDGKMVAKKYEHISNNVKLMGCKLSAPYMTLSFVPLLVIPSLKIGDKGLFDVNKFSLVSLEVDE